MSSLNRRIAMELERYTTDIDGQLMQHDSGELIHYSTYVDLATRVMAIINMAFEYEGDVFGVMHNDVVDLQSQLESIIKVDNQL